MDARYMKIFSDGITDVDATSAVEYSLSEEIISMLVTDMDRLKDVDPWNPELYAKLPLIMTYLTHALDVNLTRKYLPYYSSIDRRFKPSNQANADIIEEIQKLRRTNSKEVFVGYLYEDIIKVIPNMLFFVEDTKVLRVNKNNKNDIRKLFSDLVDGCWSDVMAAVHLYWFVQAPNFSWTDDETNKLRVKLDEWQTEMFSFLDKIKVPSIYNWYNDDVIKFTKSCWIEALNIEKRSKIINSNIVYSATAMNADLMLETMRNTPMYFEVNYNMKTIWNSILTHMQENYSKKRDLIYFYCVPSISTFIKNCNSFCDMIFEGRLASILENLKYNEFIGTDANMFRSANDEASDYLDELIGRGFPPEGVDAEEYTLNLLYGDE